LFPYFATGVVDSGVVDTGGAPGLANISANFRNFFGPNGTLLGWGETDP
jgi:hypothetical protein